LGVLALILLVVAYWFPDESEGVVYWVMERFGR
jgi:hypothetical protein